jgi:hypothetical protein
MWGPLAGVADQIRAAKQMAEITHVSQPAAKRRRCGTRDIIVVIMLIIFYINIYIFT